MTRKTEVSRSIRVNACAAIIRDGAILLVEFTDALSGLHYNLPGGGVDPGEPLRAAVRREVREETCAKVSVGRLLLSWEYVPVHQNFQYGTRHKIALCFLCELMPGSEPHYPIRPDRDQTGVCWLPLADLPNAPLIPKISDRLIAALSMLDQTIADVFYDGKQ